MKKLSHSEQRKILEQKIKDLEQHALHLEEKLDNANLSFELIGMEKLKFKRWNND